MGLSSQLPSLDIHLDPFATRFTPPPPEKEVELAWFDAPRRSSRPPRPVSPSQMPPPPPIDDPVADPWFR